MRIRAYRRGELKAVAAVYDARAAVSAGLVNRSPPVWRRMRRDRGTKGLWLVAEDRGEVVGYVVGSSSKLDAGSFEVVWRPDYDGTPIGAQLFQAVLRRVEKRRPAMTAIWSMPGQPLIPVLESSDLQRFESPAVFLAAVTDTALLLRDAKRVLGRRIDGKMHLRVDGHSTAVGAGKMAAMEVSMRANVLLGLLLGLRQLDTETEAGRVRYRPRTAEALGQLKAAFPGRVFWIEDVW